MWIYVPHIQVDQEYALSQRISSDETSGLLKEFDHLTERVQCPAITVTVSQRFPPLNHNPELCYCRPLGFHGDRLLCFEESTAC